MDLTKIYGISFDESIPQGSDMRICDAADLENDYVIGSTFQKASGHNDFDSAYPFGAIRLCAVITLPPVTKSAWVTKSMIPAFTPPS